MLSPAGTLKAPVLAGRRGVTDRFVFGAGLAMAGAAAADDASDETLSLEEDDFTDGGSTATATSLSPDSGAAPVTAFAPGSPAPMNSAAAAAAAAAPAPAPAPAPVPVPVPTAAAPAGVDVSSFDFPALGVQLGIGGVCGYAAGYATKKVGKVVLVAFGLGFIAYQVARHYRVIPDEAAIDWNHVDRQVKRALDTDGDGELTSKDVKNHFNSAMGVLSANLPSGTAFTAAFIYGLRYG